MRILLTGANGFIGRHLLQALLAEGHEVVGAVREPRAGAGAYAHPRLSWIGADFARDADKAAWLPRLAGIDAVVNTVGIFREHGTQTFENLHVRTPRALFAACAESDDVHMIVQLSALGADAGATTRYHRSKKAADDYLATLPVRACIVQSSLVYGPDGSATRAFKSLASMPFLVRLGAAAQPVQPVHVDDLAAVIVALLRQRLHVDKPVDKVVDKPGDNIGDNAVDKPPGVRTVRRLALVGPQALPFVDYLAALRAAMGLPKPRVLAAPPALVRALARVSGWLPGTLLDPDALAMLDRGSTADPAPTLRLLGRPPRTIASFVTDPDADRARAKLDWLLPLLRLALVFMWLETALVTAFVHPAQDAFALLARIGMPAALHAALLYGGGAVELLMGLAILLLRRRRWLWRAQLLLVGLVTLVAAPRLPEVLARNVPILALIWLLYELDRMEPSPIRVPPER